MDNKNQSFSLDNNQEKVLFNADLANKQTYNNGLANNNDSYSDIEHAPEAREDKISEINEQLASPILPTNSEEPLVMETEMNKEVQAESLKEQKEEQIGNQKEEQIGNQKEEQIEELVLDDLKELKSKKISETIFDSKLEIEKEQKQELESEQKQELEPESELCNGDATISKSKIKMLQGLVNNLQDTVKQLNDILAPHINSDKDIKIQLGQVADTFSKISSSESSTNESQVVEGLFNGEKMITADGKEYSVPVNYASKSKLVDGDMLKLIITERGTFVFKQIKPVERVRTVGILEQGPTGEYYVSTNSRRWRVLSASVSYFKGDSGDEAIILIPKEGRSRWAAVENIVRKS